MTVTNSGTSVKILVCDGVGQELLDGLTLAGYDVDYRPEISHRELIDSIPEYSCIVVRSRTKVTGEVLEAGRNLKYIARAGIGTDNIDMDMAERLSIGVLTAAGASTRSVVELNIALAIDLARNIVPLNIMIRDGEYRKKKGREISGSVCGIVGFGRIGYETAMILSALGADIVAYDVVQHEDLIKDVAGRYVSLDELLSTSDFIFTTVTLTDGSRGLMDRDSLSKLKEGSLIINTSRAEAFSGSALVDGLKDGSIGGYATDVMWNEPPTEDYERELIGLDNVVVTPHIGAQTREGQRRVALATLENIRNAMGGSSA